MRGSWLLRCRYNGRLAARLWWLPRARWPCRSRSRSAAAAFNYQLDSLFAKSKNEPDITASLRPRSRAKPLADSPPAVDLAIARRSVRCFPTAARTPPCRGRTPRPAHTAPSPPIASAYSQDGLTCRDFLASFVRNGGDTWDVRGKPAVGPWQVGSAPPQALAAHVSALGCAAAFPKTLILTIHHQGSKLRLAARRTRAADPYAGSAKRAQADARNGPFAGINRAWEHRRCCMSNL